MSCFNPWRSRKKERKKLRHLTQHCCFEFIMRAFQYNVGILTVFVVVTPLTSWLGYYILCPEWEMQTVVGYGSSLQSSGILEWFHEVVFTEAQHILLMKQLVHSVLNKLWHLVTGALKEYIRCLRIFIIDHWWSFYQQLYKKYPRKIVILIKWYEWNPL